MPWPIEIEPARDRFWRQLVLERYGADVDVVRQGEPGDTLYLIGQGQVDVLRTDGVKDRRINTLTATVRTAAPSELYSLSREDFTVLLQQAPAIREAITATVARRQTALAAAQTGASATAN